MLWRRPDFFTFQILPIQIIIDTLKTCFKWNFCFQHRFITKIIYFPLDVDVYHWHLADNRDTVLLFCFYFHRASKTISSLWTCNLSHQSKQLNSWHPIFEKNETNFSDLRHSCCTSIGRFNKNHWFFLLF